MVTFVVGEILEGFGHVGDLRLQFTLLALQIVTECAGLIGGGSRFFGRSLRCFRGGTRIGSGLVELRDLYCRVVGNHVERRHLVEQLLRRVTHHQRKEAIGSRTLVIRCGNTVYRRSELGDARRSRVEKTLIGEGNGALDAFADAVSILGYEARVLDYTSHALSSGTDAVAVAYVETEIGEGDDIRVIWGVGMHESITTAAQRSTP